MKKFFLTMAAMAAVMQALACTSIIVAKGASTDGSVIPTGTLVKVDRIEGVKAFVTPVKEPVKS